MKKYSEPNADSISFVLINSKNKIRGVAICDRWVNKKFDRKTAPPQIYIGLLCAPCHGKILLKHIFRYAIRSSYKKVKFEFITAAAIEGSKKFFVNQGFRPGYGHDIHCNYKFDEILDEDEFPLLGKEFPMYICLNPTG